MSEKVWARAGVIVYHIDPVTKKCSVLIGKESVFLKDKIEKLQLLNPDTGLPFTQETFSEYQNVKADSANDATQLFNWRAQALSLALMQPVKYDKPRFFSESGIYRVHFRIAKHQNAGIIKGRIDGNESPLRAALRELHEEVGMSVKQVRLTWEYRDNLDYMYSVCVSDITRKELENVIAERNRVSYGEMFDLQFLPLTIKALKRYSVRYNDVSHKALMRFRRKLKNPVIQT
jgi:ADP-ribose pyrophosphatase YjhB (NUDIX family)